jgi:hypothetical protein
MHLPCCKNLRILILPGASSGACCASICCFSDEEPVVLNVLTIQHAVAPERTEIPENILLSFL